MDKYESITYLEIKGQEPIILNTSHFNLLYEADDRQSFVYTRTRRISRDGKFTEWGLSGAKA